MWRARSAAPLLELSVQGWPRFRSRAPFAPRLRCDPLPHEIRIAHQISFDRVGPYYVTGNAFDTNFVTAMLPNNNVAIEAFRGATRIACILI
jgi:hypothetical protein